MELWINDGLHEAAEDIHSFLLVGQSNMAGRGGPDGGKCPYRPGLLYAADGTLAAYE